MRVVLFALPILAATAAVGRAQDAKGVAFFEGKIRPVLVEQCYKCHAGEKTKGGLALDTRAGLRDGGDGGPAVVPGDPKKGTLLKALRHDGPVRMPNEQRKLPDAVLADFEAWVRMGAPDPRDGKLVVKRGIDYDAARKHWAYRPVAATPPPAVTDAVWPADPLDRFILAGLESKGLRPAADAAPHAWLRRVTFDLTGLPPPPEEVADFARTPDRAKVVDRLLASPRFGEQWARHWLDGVRFEQAVPTVDRYRDWVVRALNADLPYPEFVRLQLAGDLLTESAAPADRLAATQFLALAYREMDPVEGMVEVLGQHVLGVSINCAKCHDHKLDAFSQLDYYALAGVFTSTQILGAKGPTTAGVDVPGEPGAKILAVADSAKGVGDTVLLLRGEKSAKGPVVPRRFPLALAADVPLRPRGSGRLELANWVADPAHPLTARVFVNRVWQRLFGAGLVRTPNDFGLSGDAPTHPALLDHLADRFSKDGGSVKKLVRAVVLSRTYRQAATNPAAVAADPDNRFVGRAAVRRLSYEQIVDNLNAVSGRLTFDRPPPVKNANSLPRFTTKALDAPAVRALYHDDAQVRTLFDGADPDLITDARDASVTAPQLLFFLNNPQVVALAGRIARRLEAAGGDRVTAAYTILFARPPSAAERAAAVAYLGRNPLDRLCHTLLATSEFIYLE